MRTARYSPCFCAPVRCLLRVPNPLTTASTQGVNTNSVVNALAVQTDIAGPTGSGTFGSTVTVLPNGNFVVTDLTFSIPSGAANVGAVYLYNGATRALISTLTGSTANDYVGSGNYVGSGCVCGITVLTNGNYVVSSPSWDNGATIDAGAATADAGGNYSFHIPYDWTGTVTPSKTGATFTPASRSYTNVIADQNAQNYAAKFITATYLIYLPLVTR